VDYWSEFPYATDAFGAWRTKPASQTEGYTGEGSFGNWFCGFWIGMLLAAFLHSGRQHFLDAAMSRIRSIVPHSDDRNTHDIGFNLCTSIPSAYHIMGDPWLRDVGVHGANQLRSRLVTTRDNAYIPSWPLLDDRGSRTVQIDTMPILPLLYWATEESKDADLREAGEAHAQTTREHFVRPDYSTVHAVEFDSLSGRPTRKFTFRGYADDSCWSRGQAWAIYGFVATACATRRIKYLQLAERLTDYFLSRLDATLIPFWDLDDPSNPNSPRDSSAAAIVASAMLDLSALHPDAGSGVEWKRRGLALLAKLCEYCLAKEATHRGLLKHGCYRKPNNDGLDCASTYGDFYFVEALCAACMPNALRPAPSRLT
jgi:unsaturated chondroitin disaccharide hydrolase